MKLFKKITSVFASLKGSACRSFVAKGYADGTQAGFTLVELLIVIGVLGILAAGLLATLDPLEQLRKGQDSTKQQASRDFANAAISYFASRQAFPWDTVANGGAGCNGGAAPTDGKLLSAMSDCLTAMVAGGDLKSTFASQTNIVNALSIAEVLDSGQRIVVTCFNPDSKSVSSQATYSDIKGTLAPQGQAGTYWCFR